MSDLVSAVEGGLAAVRERVGAACARAGRAADSVQLVAVSKGQPAAAIRVAVAKGQVDFGESYVQEWVEKRAAIPGVRWHFIGHLQSNKARLVAGHTALVHSVDRQSLVDALSREGGRQDVLVQVNIAGETSKSGVPPEQAAALVAHANASGVLSVRGLMCIPPAGDAETVARPVFRALRELFVGLRGGMSVDHAARFTELSMGMSDDLEVAIEEGATLVRVGTAVFGPRSV